MYRPLSLYIGLRYTRAKRRNHFISFISAVSMIGIALGVAVLITVLSVMNGFDYQIHKHLFNISNQVSITDASGTLLNWQDLATKVNKTNDVVASAPFISGQGMLSNQGAVQGVMLTGILPKYEANVSTIDQHMVRGSMNKLTAGSFGVVIGQTLALDLGLDVGDKVTLITPKATFTPVGVMPRFKRFNVVGIFRMGDGQFGYDSGFAFINLHDAQTLLQMGDGVTGLRLKVDNLYVAPRVADNLINTLPERYMISNWTQQYATYFQAISMEKTMMFVILLFIIAVAAFNLISSLVMTVTDKQADIAILRTLGARPRTIMGVFMVQGAVVGILGTLIGVLGGILLAIYTPNIVAFIEHTFHTQFISASIYFINYLPSKLEWQNVVQVGVAALFMSLLATIYPAWKASRTQPAEALRYE